MKIAVYWVAWLLFVLAQAQNSLLSNSNTLSGWPGFKVWFRVQWINIATRAFFSAVLYSTLIQQVASRIQSLGFVLTGTAVAGIAGYSANAALYQTFGLLAKVIPFLRVEVHDLAPPPVEAPGEKP